MGEPLQLNLQFLLCKFVVGKTSCESLEWDLKEYTKTCVNEKVLLQALKLQFETSWRQKFQAGISTENKKKNKEKKNIICFYPKPSSTLSFHLDLSKIHILSLSPKVYHKTSTARLLDWLLEVNFCPSKTNQRHKNRY